MVPTLNSEVTEVCTAQGGKHLHVWARCQASFHLPWTQVGLAANLRHRGHRAGLPSLLSSAKHQGQWRPCYRNVESKSQDPRARSKPAHAQARPDLIRLWLQIPAQECCLNRGL